MLSLALCGLSLVVLLVAWTPRAAEEKSRVLGLPGFDGNLASRHYAGYITIDQNHGRALYYYFVTSERNSSSDPLILWLNGGPGCSSFDGFVYEHGPFHFVPGKGAEDMPVLVRNPYTWAKIANIIYLDSPAGVGFSYSNTSSDYSTGDIKTALDSHTFLLEWFKVYPEFINNEFYVIGESYAGVYVPSLSQQIVNGVEAGVEPIPNFKGYMIGNGCTDARFDHNGLVPFIYGMGLISTDMFEEVSSACHGNYWNATTADCLSRLAAVYEEVSDLNTYDILEPCYHDPDAWLQDDRKHLKLPSSLRKLGETATGIPIRKRLFGRAWPLRMPLPPQGSTISSWRELGAPHHLRCMDTQVSHIWLNSPSVRKALHAMPEDLIGRWTVCSDTISYTHDMGSMIPIHRNLTAKGYRVHIFSGDHDMCVPYTGSEAWTRSLGYRTTRSWHPWYVDDQVAAPRSPWRRRCSIWSTDPWSLGCQRSRSCWHKEQAAHGIPSPSPPCSGSPGPWSTTLFCCCWRSEPSDSKYLASEGRRFRSGMDLARSKAGGDDGGRRQSGADENDAKCPAAEPL